MPRKLDIRALAKKSGFSVGTVSMAMNDNPRVKASTREKIHRVARELGYQKSIIAQIVSKRHNRAVGTVLPNSVPSFFGEVLHGLVLECEKADQPCFIGFSSDNPSTELYYLRMFRQLRLRGLLHSPCPGTQSLQILKEMAATGTRVLLIEREIEGFDADFVGFDYKTATHQAARALLKAGHRDFAVITTDRPFSSVRERLEGFSTALEEFRISPRRLPQIRFDSMVFSHSPTALHESTRQIAGLLAAHRPSALLLAMDGACGIVHNAAASLGWRIPEDLNLISFDQTLPPKPSSEDFIRVLCPLKDLGRLAGTRMLETLADPPQPLKRVLLSADLWPRDPHGPNPRRKSPKGMK